MVRPAQLLESVKFSIENEPDIPDQMNYLLQEPALHDEDSNVKLPAVILQIINVDTIKDHNTDQVGFTQDANGYDDGIKYHDEYTMLVQADVYTAQRSNFDANVLGSSVKNALYMHQPEAEGKPLLDDGGNPIDEVWNFQIIEAMRQDDTLDTPTLRRWRKNLRLWAYHEYTEHKGTILNVETPSS